MIDLLPVHLIRLTHFAILAAPPVPAMATGFFDSWTNEPFDYDAVLANILEPLSFLANVAGGVVVGVAVLRGLLTYAVALIRDRGSEIPKEAIRLSLGRSLSLALEFQVGADILDTALNPTREDLIILAAVVALRTILNYFLGREIDEAQRREQRAGGTGASGTMTPVGGTPGDTPGDSARRA